MARAVWAARSGRAHLVVDGDTLTLCGEYKGDAPEVTPEQVVETRMLICEKCVELSGEISAAVAAIAGLAAAVTPGVVAHRRGIQWEDTDDGMIS